MLKKKKVNKQENVKATNLLIGLWVTLFLFVTIAFCGYTNTLDIESQATMQSHIYDYVYITNMSIKDSSNASSINYSYMD